MNAKLHEVYRQDASKVLQGRNEFVAYGVNGFDYAGLLISVNLFPNSCYIHPDGVWRDLGLL